MITATPVPNEYTPSILVVDDEERIRQACRMILEEDGYDVTTASDGTQGVDLINARHFDIILLDLMMPTLSGFDVLARVKQLHPDSVVIIITGYATLEHSVEAMKKGAFDFIPKPFTPDHLRVVISKALGHTMALRDITNTHNRMRTMVNRLNEGVMCVNRAKAVVFANTAFLDLLNVQGEIDFVGKPLDAFFQETQIDDMIDAALRTETTSTADLRKDIIIPEGQASREKVIDARCVPFRDRSGVIIGAITVLHDITAIRRMDEMKSHFVSMVSHEIRSPMNSLLMQLQVIMDGLAGEVTDKQMEILKRASLKISSLSQMTSELLDLASIESGLVVREKTHLELTEVLQEQLALHGPQADEQSIELVAAAIETTLPVRANRRSMEEVFSNLITNAIKYTPAGGRVTVSAEVEDHWLCIRISDTGFGFDEEEKAKIFERFYRIKNPQTRFIQGTGLGLSIVSAIIEDHQGRIEVDSTPGSGSTFSVFLPLANE